MQTIACTGQSEARARNRWFWVAEAAALAQAVQDAVQQLCPVPPADCPCCPRCLATEALAYGALTVESTLVVQDAACITCGAGWHDIYIYSGSVVQDA